MTFFGHHPLRHVTIRVQTISPKLSPQKIVEFSSWGLHLHPRTLLRVWSMSSLSIVTVVVVVFAIISFVHRLWSHHQVVNVTSPSCSVHLALPPTMPSSPRCVYYDCRHVSNRWRHVTSRHRLHAVIVLVLSHYSQLPRQQLAGCLGC